MRHILVTLLAATLAASTAQADQRAPDPIKKARAEALVAASKSQGVWRVDATGGITHIASGLTCHVTDSTNQVVELVVHPTPAQGVSCRYEDNSPAEKATFVLSVYANQGLTREQLRAQSVEPIRAAHPDWKEVEPPKIFITVTDDNTGEDLTPVATRFATGGSSQEFSSLWIGKTGSWAIKVHATYPKATAEKTEMGALGFWAVAHLCLTGECAKAIP